MARWTLMAPWLGRTATPANARGSHRGRLIEFRSVWRVGPRSKPHRSWLVVGSPAVVEAAMITPLGRTGRGCEIPVHRVCMVMVVVTSLLSLYQLGKPLSSASTAPLLTVIIAAATASTIFFISPIPRSISLVGTNVLRHGPVFNWYAVEVDGPIARVGRLSRHNG
jgi:hypothetical protein